nr:uncharacterized protein LOC117844155 [Setaria viridis]
MDYEEEQKDQAELQVKAVEVDASDALYLDLQGDREKHAYAIFKDWAFSHTKAYDPQRTEELTAHVATTQQVIDDLQRREQAAWEDAWRPKAKFHAVAEKARYDHEEFQDAAEKARHDAEELARLKGEHEALQKTVEHIQRERQKAWQDQDSETARKEEAEKVAADRGAEVSQLQVQVQELQASVAQGLDWERQLKAQSKGKTLFVSLSLWCCGGF